MQVRHLLRLCRRLRECLSAAGRVRRRVRCGAASQFRCRAAQPCGLRLLLRVLGDGNPAGANVRGIGLSNQALPELD